MDPKANIKEQMEIIARIQELDYEFKIDLETIADLAYKLTELVEALHMWRMAGGYDPYVSKKEV